MKKNTLKSFFFGAFIFGAISSFAQEKRMLKQTPIQLTEENQRFLDEYGVVRCYSTENELALQQESPKRYQTEDFENWIAPLIEKVKEDRIAGRMLPVYDIPVVVHVIHNGDAEGTDENISDAQVLSQISVLNEDFRRMASTPGGANSTGVAVDVEINFCMAQTDPSGTLTDGIVRHNITPYGNSHTPGTVDDWETRADVQTVKANTQWDPTNYMNMWSVKFGGNATNHPTDPGMQGILGYAQFPSNSGLTGLNTNGGAANTDGVVSGYQFFGTSDDDDGSFTLSAPYDKGRTMTHEVGHYLGLRHIWGDGGCGVDDFCADTPESDASNGGCPTTHTSCGTLDQVQNYMDYTNDTCMDTFTQDQKDRMVAVMQGATRRASLTSSTRCQAPTPLISFSTVSQAINEGTDCGTTDVTVTLNIGKAPVGGNPTVTINTAGTANAQDYQIIGSPVTFTAGSTADQTFTVRINNDSFVEADETIIMTMSLSANGSDATITTEATQQQILTITNDDLAPNATTNTVAFQYTTDITGWGLINVDGGTTWGNFGSGIDVPGVIEPNFLGSRAEDATTNDYIISPAFTVPAGITALSLEHALFSVNATQNYELYFSTNTTNEANVQAGTLISSGTATDYSATPTLETINLSAAQVTALSGQTGSLVLRHTSNTADLGYLVWDTITFTASTITGVQTALNTGSPDQDSLSITGAVYSADTSSGDMMADIVNNNGVDYGCVSTSVSRASGAAQMYQVAGVANYVMGKTFTITPASVQASGNATVKFYFTEAEIAQWEGDTGNSRNDLRVIKDNGASESVVATIGAFGTNVTLEATFTTGINGTYYFGREQALTVGSNDYALFSVYPNPANSYLDINLSANEDVQLSLFDIRGREIFTKLERNNNETFTTRLDLQGVSSGVYMLNVKSGNKNATKKIVIQ